MATDLKARAIEFLQQAASGRAHAEAATHLAPGFRHHNPHFAGDGESLLTAMDKNAAQFPGTRLEVVHALQDGDMVSTLCKVQHTPDEAGYAVAHVFRFENGKIAELWDLAQEIPKETPNQYGAV